MARSAWACPSRTFDRGGLVARECSVAPGMAGDRPPPYGSRGGFRPIHRSAWACPSRTFDRGGLVARECSVAPGMAGDRPPPYGSRTVFALFIVARGPVPRERSIVVGLSLASVRWPRAWRGTGPRPTGPQGSLARSARACPSRTFDCARACPSRTFDRGGLVARECSVVPGMAGDRPPPYGSRGGFRPIHRSAWACCSRVFGCPGHGGGQPQGRLQNKEIHPHETNRRRQRRKRK